MFRELTESLDEAKESINAFNQGVDNFSNGVQNFFEGIGNVIYVITHPIIIWQITMAILPIAVTLICMTSLMFYGILKEKRAAKLTIKTLIIYFLLKAVDLVI